MKAEVRGEGRITGPDPVLVNFCEGVAWLYHPSWVSPSFLAGEANRPLLAGLTSGGLPQ